MVDVGGTTTDVGYLRAGFPREAPREVEVGGVRTLFRMPDLLSIALGGGSLVSEDGAVVGPASVGFRLAEEGLVFGGRTPTATDFGVAAGWAAIGDPARVRGLSRQSVGRFAEVVEDVVAEAVDRMKPDARECPLLAVGGGAFLVPARLEGISETVTVPHAGVANAVGAAIARSWRGGQGVPQRGAGRSVPPGSGGGGGAGGRGRRGPVRARDRRAGGSAAGLLAWRCAAGAGPGGGGGGIAGAALPLSRAIYARGRYVLPPAFGGLCRPPPGELAGGRRSLA